MWLFYGVLSFNLEPSIPVIKVGNRNSYFGVSVAEHRTEENGTSWLLVGAPLDQNLQPNTTRSGALWRCPLTTSMNDCEQVITDGRRSIDSDHLEGPFKDEIKEGQWLGVSVRSQGVGKKIVVCAHRYITKKGESQYGQGMCYTLNNNMGYHELWEPCKGRSVLREHEDYGFCQVGTSSTMLNDDTLIIGAPGPYTWRGTIFTHDTRDSYFEQDRSVYMAPVEDSTSPVEKYSYLGMSVVGAQFFSKYFTYVAGAPRARRTGQVVMFDKRQDWSSIDLNVRMTLNGEQFGSNFGYEMATADVNGDRLPDLIVGAPFYFSKDIGGAIYLYLNKNHSINTTHDVKLTGKPESQFGISIANAGDLNRDGCEDIAVGAPYEDFGVVYIYMGRRIEGLINTPDQRIQAADLPVKLRTFGYSLSGGMDLDSNGYPDLLVGAYDSYSVALLRARPIVDIKTSILNNFEKKSDIISNIDPSAHGCSKDPSSDYTCFHFQSCCKIESQVDSPESKGAFPISYNIEAETFSGGKKYSRIFFDSTNVKKSFTSNIIYVKKNEEVCIEHIAYLKNNTRDIQTPIKFQMTYKIEQQPPVYNTKGALPNIDAYPVLNATATSFFTANFLNDCGEDNLCVSDLVVEPKLLLPTGGDNNYTLTLGQDDEIKLEVAVKNYGESAYEPHLFVKYHTSLHFIGVEYSERRVICSAKENKPIVNCRLENPLKETKFPDAHPKPKIILRFDSRALDDNEPSVAFEVWANSTSQPLYPKKRPVKLQALVVKNAELVIQGISLPEQVFYGGEVKGESAMKYFEDIGAGVVHKYQIFNEGPWRVNSVQVLISWPHQVAGDRPQGKWLLYPEAIPKVEGDQIDERQGECFVPSPEINPLNLTHKLGAPQMLIAKEDPFLNSRMSKLRSEKRNSVFYKETSNSSSLNNVRRKREEPAIAEPFTKEGPPKIVKHINCDNKNAKCIKIQCVIYKIERNRAVTITVSSRLWNSTLIEDTSSNVNSIKVASSASILIPERYNIHQNRLNDDIATVETTAYPDFKITETTEVPSWVIIVSVIVGLLVLIIIVLLMWYFGFFKRSRPDFTLSGNLEKNHESKPFIEQNANNKYNL